MSVAITGNQVHALHDNVRHIERALRLETIMERVAEAGLLDQLISFPSGLASEQQILAVHDAALWQRVSETARSERGKIDGDTYTTAGSFEAALGSAGATIGAVDAVLGGHARYGFALTRPPGHHATPSTAMGFCLFNNVAIAARHAQSQYGVSRVAIVDFDVHHGNGTQDCFYQDEQVFFCSTHAWPLYPGSGKTRECGRDAGFGRTLNVSLPHATGDLGFLAAYDQLIFPALQAFKPELLLVSAGYDAHWTDPVGKLAVTVSGFAELTRRLKLFADEVCAGNLVMVLEGGYNIDALAHSVLASIKVLLGQDAGKDVLGVPPHSFDDLAELFDAVREVHPAFA